MNISSQLKRCLSESSEYFVSIAIYFVLNVYVLQYFASLPLAIILSVAVYVLVFAFAFSDYCTDFLALLQGARPLKTNKEKNLLLPTFDEVIASSNLLQGAEFRLYIVNDFSVNAHTIGYNGVGITKGATFVLSKEQLKGVIAHELAHISLGHTFAGIISTFGGGIFSIASILLSLSLELLRKDSEAIDTTRLNFVTRTMITLVGSLYFLVNFQMEFFSSIRKRKREFEADVFASRMDYGDQLISALYTIDEIVAEGFMDMKQHLTRSHPYLYERIERLENITGCPDVEPLESIVRPEKSKKGKARR